MSERTFPIMLLAVSFITHPVNIDALPIEPDLDRDGGEVRL